MGKYGERNLIPMTNNKDLAWNLVITTHDRNYILKPKQPTDTGKRGR